MHMPLNVSPVPVRTDNLKAVGPLSVAAALNAVLASGFALYLKTRNCQLRLQGRPLQSYQDLLGRHADQLFRTTEAIAERVGQTGASALFAINVAAPGLSGDQPDPTLGAMLGELRDDNVAFIETLWQAKAIMDEAGDRLSSRLIDAWTDEAEARAWFLFGAAWE